MSQHEHCATLGESPVLCLDTCSVLDILRDPGRRDVAVQEQAASLSLLDIAELGSALEVRVADQVRHEYADRVAEVEEETTRGLSRFRRQIHKIDELVALHGAEGKVAIDHWDAHPERCRQAADRWMQIARSASPSSDVVGRAYARVMKASRPARRGGGEMKDCVVLETYLAYVREVRESSARTVVFVSSNTRDFANERGNDVADEIRDEFLELNLKYAPNMRMARRLLGLLPSTV